MTVKIHLGSALLGALAFSLVLLVLGANFPFLLNSGTPCSSRHSVEQRWNSSRPTRPSSLSTYIARTSSHEWALPGTRGLLRNRPTAAKAHQGRATEARPGAVL